MRRLPPAARTSRPAPGLLLAELYQTGEEILSGTLVQRTGQLPHGGPLGAFPHQPLLEHLVNLLFQSVSLIVMVNLVDLRFGEAQLPGTVFPVFSQVVPDGAQVFVRQTRGVIKDGLVLRSWLL